MINFDWVSCKTLRPYPFFHKVIFEVPHLKSRCLHSIKIGFLGHNKAFSTLTSLTALTRFVWNASLWKSFPMMLKTRWDLYSWIINTILLIYIALNPAVAASLGKVELCRRKRTRIYRRSEIFIVYVGQEPFIDVSKRRKRSLSWITAHDILDDVSYPILQHL